MPDVIPPAPPIRFASLADVDAFVAEHSRRAIDDLYLSGRLDARDLAVIEAWFDSEPSEGTGT